MRPDSIWEVDFQIHNPIPALPTPWELVEEVQSDPGYRWDGHIRQRKKGSQFQLTLEGEGRFWDADGEHTLTPGKGFLAKHYEPGTAYYYPPDGTKDWRFLWLSFYGTSLDIMVDGMIKRYGHMYEVSPDRSVIKRLRAFRNLESSLHFLAPMEGAALVTNLLTVLGEYAERDLFESRQSRLTRLAQEYFVSNIDKDISVANLAERLQVSREYLSRTFKEQTGISLQDYMREKRIEIASRLLRQTRLSCQEIAHRVSYHRLSSFTRAFKILTGQSPTSFREQGKPSL